MLNLQPLPTTPKTDTLLWKPCQPRDKRRWLQSTRLRRAAGHPSDPLRTFGAVAVLEDAGSLVLSIISALRASLTIIQSTTYKIVKSTEQGRAS